MSATIDLEIDRVKAALVWRHAELDALSDEWKRAGLPCCPACAYPDRWTPIWDQRDRTAAWLCVLLRKRGAPGDELLASDIEMQAWP